MKQNSSRSSIGCSTALCLVTCSVLAGEIRPIEVGKNQELRGRLEFTEKSDYKGRLVLEDGQICYLFGPIIDLGNIPKDRHGRIFAVRGDVESFTDAQRERGLRMRVRDAKFAPRPKEPWQTDFERFLALLDRATTAADTEHAFVGRDVRWKGTLKYLHKGRPYIKESFVRVGEKTKAARVMYYTETAHVKLWKEVKPGATVEYTGVIANVKEATGIAKKPFIYVDLHQVQVFKWQPANNRMDDER